MEFLKYVAEDLRKMYGNDMSRVAVVFQNKRAGIFMDHYLLEGGGDTAVWAPQYYTISDLFDSLCPLRRVDDIKAVCTLYKIYVEEVHAAGIVKSEADISLDYFYGWGQQLVSDFSDIDRSMADPDSILGNWEAINVLEERSKEERRLLEPLTEVLSKESSLKSDFQKLWNCLGRIYHRLNEALAGENLAYEGQRQRLVIEGLRSGELKLPQSIERYVFVGFNMLLPVEQALFSFLKDDGETEKSRRRALFYWDYDELYCSKDSPLTFGRTMRRNLEQFGNDMEADCFDNLSHRDEPLQFVAARSDSAQTQYASQWLEKRLGSKDGRPEGLERRTAVVLCDETMLQPMVHGIPDNVDVVNITKGFPMTHTPAYAFVVKKLDEYNADKTKDGATNEQLLQLLEKDVKKEALSLNSSNEQQEWLRQLTAESFFQCHKIVLLLTNYVSDGTLTVGRRTLWGLLRQILGLVSIPFHGEPADGLQVMGMLETRNLDFENVLFLSVNEGIVPKPAPDRSFIPYDLRVVHHIMTNKDRSEVYAYNFFRLLQRARHATLVFNESTDGDKHSGEMSRFMMQILTETDIPVRMFSLQEQSASKAGLGPALVPPGADHPLKSARLSLSPSALNEYISCPAKFFFNHVLHIAYVEPESVILAPNDIGTIFHKAAELIYKDLMHDCQNVTIKPSDLERIRNNQLQQYVERAFEEASREEVHKRGLPASTNLFPYEKHKVEGTVILRFLKILMDVDIREARTPFGLVMRGTEKEEIAWLADDLKIKGVIDRLDTVNMKSRVVDYKTGSYSDTKMKCSSFESLFKGNGQYVMQTLFYDLLCQKNHIVNNETVLLFLQKMKNESYDGRVKFEPTDLGTYSTPGLNKLQEFEERLKDKVDEMRHSLFDRKIDAYHACAYCPYTIFCGVVQS
jgi:RecB family exonuclease